ncbi:MAG: mevalonate kinase [Deltaproteobacteria bacterium]|nr:mevalonate kinase [Deltaproteobacteria bacterium]
MTGAIHTGCAGSKIILLGEHAVVHGEDALVLGMPEAVCATCRHADGFSVSIPAWTAPSGENSRTPRNTGRDAIPDGMTGAFHCMFSKMKIDPPAVALEVTAGIPARAGLGASAALGVACARAINSLLNLRLTDDDIFEAVLAFENVFHHNSSGVDIRAAAHVGCGLYNRHRGYIAIEADLPLLLVVHSGVPGATGDTVKRFANRLQSHPDGPRQLKRLGELTRPGKSALVQRDWRSLGALMTEAHRILSWFDVSSPQLDNICRLAMRHGAPGAKLTGGGGGGCAIILLEREDQRPAMRQIVQQAGYTVIM